MASEQQLYCPYCTNFLVLHILALKQFQELHIYKYIPFKQPREVVLVDALSCHGEVDRQQRQSDGQQVWFTAQPVAEHGAGNQAHEVDLRDQSKVRNVRDELEKHHERKGRTKQRVFTLWVSISRSFLYRFTIRLRYVSSSACFFCLANQKS